jgi:hypothetical protein
MSQSDACILSEKTVILDIRQQQDQQRIEYTANIYPINYDRLFMESFMRASNDSLFEAIFL